MAWKKRQSNCLRYTKHMIIQSQRVTQGGDRTITMMYNSFKADSSESEMGNNACSELLGGGGLHFQGDTSLYF